NFQTKITLVRTDTLVEAWREGATRRSRAGRSIAPWAGATAPVPRRGGDAPGGAAPWAGMSWRSSTRLLRVLWERARRLPTSYQQTTVLNLPRSSARMVLIAVWLLSEEG